MTTSPRPDSLTTTGDRSALRTERRLPHPPEAVWAALTDPERLARWFPFEVTVDLVPGGTIGFHLPGESAPAASGTVTDLDEPRLFGFTWGTDQLSWSIRPDGDGSLLTLVHTFGDLPGAASFAAGWHLCLGALGQLLDGGPVEAGRDDGALHDAYVERFGLGRGVVESVPGGRRLRLERQLVRPAEVVWDTLCAGVEPVPGLPVPEGFTAEKVEAGHVTEVRPPGFVTFAVDPDGAVSWELGEGTGHGARLVLTQSGPEGFDAETALAAWQERIERLAARLLTRPSRP